jgi:hypothetical protein
MAFFNVATKKVAEKSQGALKIMHFMLSPLMDLCYTMQFHLELQSMVHIMIQCCAIMCDMPSVQNNSCCCNMASSSLRTKRYLILSWLCCKTGWEILAHPPYLSVVAL